LAADGTLSGVASGLGTFEFTVKVTDRAGNSDTKALSLRVAIVAVTTPGLEGYVLKAYSTTLAAVGGTGGYTWTVAAGALPPGLKLGSTGKILGKPTAIGTSAVTFQVRDQGGHVATQDYAFVINPMTITNEGLPDGLVGKRLSAKLTYAGGAGTHVWSIAAGELPAGLKLSSSGAISGTAKIPGTSTFTAQVVDSSKPKYFASRKFTLRISPMTVSTATVPGGLVGKTYPYTKLSTAGGFGTKHWVVATGTLPVGLKLSASGTLSGTPSTPGVFTFTVEVTDSGNPQNSASRYFLVIVAPMTVSTDALPDGSLGTSYARTQLIASGGKGTLKWSIDSGVLPPGLTTSSSGLVSGVPTATGTFTFTVKAVDSSVPTNAAVKQLTITVS
jgi:hypothetical protein